jgi:hypothetical protein
VLNIFAGNFLYCKMSFYVSVCLGILSVYG